MGMIHLTIKLVTVAILLVVILYLLTDLFSSKTSKDECEINGVKLGNLFKLICEIDEGIKLYLDTQTGFMYLVSENGVTPVLNQRGKPRKYEEFLESVKGDTDDWQE